MKRILPLTLLMAVMALPVEVAAAPAQPFQLAETVHPYTQQLYDQWLTKLTESEAVSRPNGDIEKARPVLEAGEEWFKEKRQTLNRHPQFSKGLVRQLMLRMKLAKITAFYALVVADVAKKTNNADLFSAKDGAYAQLDKADAWVQALKNDVSDPNQEMITSTQAAIDDIRRKTKAHADAMQGGGPGGGISLALPMGANVHSYVQMQFKKWVENITVDKAIAAGNKPTAEKIKELEGGYRWFQSNEQELKKHPNYSQGLPHMAALILNLAEFKAQQAVEFAQKGLKEMNVNYFSESSGTYQQLQEAERLVTSFSSLADGQKATKAIADAKVTIGKLSEEYNKKAAAAFRLPAEAYNGGDKAQLKQMVLAKWRSLYPKDQVLGVRFLKSAWERRKEANWNNGSWYFYDNSTLLTYVVIKKSAELATVYPVYVNKNNQNSEIKIGAETKGNGFSHSDMLLKNVKF